MPRASARVAAGRASDQISSCHVRRGHFTLKRRRFGTNIVVTRLAAAVFILASCARAPETIRIDGSPGAMPLVTALVTDYGARNSSVQFVTGTGLGSSLRVPALASGRIEIAVASHGIDTAEIRRHALAMHEIARTAVVFGVNSGVPVPGLTRRQLCDIYSGAVTNWRELGGPDLQIRAGMRPPTEVDAEVARAEIECLRAPRFGPHVQIIVLPADMATAIASTPGAIGLTSMTVVEQSGGRIRALSLDGAEPTLENVGSGAYPMHRKAILIINARP